MIFKAQKKAKKHLRRQKLSGPVKKTGYVILAFCCAWFIVSGWQIRPQAKAVPHLLLAVDDIGFDKQVPPLETVNEVTEKPKVEFQPLCLDEGLAEDFLYREEKVRIKPAETLNIEKARQEFEVPTAFKLASLVPAAVSMEVTPQKNEIFKEIEHIDSLHLDDKAATERLEKIYEEDLPNDIVVADPQEDEPQSPYVHTNHKNIKDIPVKIYHKPLYFGPEPVVAVVIDDMGISLSRTKDIISLRAPLTSSFLTYASKLREQADAARLAGHEIMAHIPMEPKRLVDVAPDVLTVDMDDAEIRSDLEKMLQKYGPLAGINNHMGSRFTEDRHRMEVVMQILHDRKMFFLDSKTTPLSQGRQAAKTKKVAYAFRNVFLDNVNDFNYISKQLQLAEKLARRNGYAIVIGHPKSQTYKALQAWLPTLKEKKIKLVPLSQIVAVLNQPR